MGIAAQLEGLANIPMVAKELSFIAEVQTDEYRQDVTLPIPERADAGAIS